MPVRPRTSSVASKLSSLLSLAAVVVSGVVYHLAQKTAAAAHPWRLLSVAYGAAFAFSSVLALATGPVRLAAFERVRGGQRVHHAGPGPAGGVALR